MVGKVIRDYIDGGAKKLTVPGFGTFMRRDDGAVIFVDLLRTDDGALREMVEDRGNYSEVEAMALIDRFIFETKNSIARRGSVSIDGFGTMSVDRKGVYQFDYSPRIRPSKEHAVQERLFERESARAARPEAAKANPRPEAAKLRTVQPATTRPAEVRRREQPPRPTQRQPERRSQAVRRDRRPQSGKSATDTILIVAIVAAVIALAALIFGMTSGNMPFLQR